MTPEQLKASILQMAIQGKLVEQRAEEGTAEDAKTADEKLADALAKVRDNLKTDEDGNVNLS